MHLNEKVLHDRNARVRVRALNLNNASLRCGIIISKYTSRVVLLLVIDIVVVKPGRFPATQGRESLTNGEAIWRRTISQTSIPQTRMVECQIGFTDNVGKKFA
jgi:hypothetical protein